MKSAVTRNSWLRSARRARHSVNTAERGDEPGRFARVSFLDGYRVELIEKR